MPSGAGGLSLIAEGQKPICVLEEDLVNLTGGSRQDLTAVNALRLKRREKPETARREMEEAGNRGEQEEQNIKPPARRPMNCAPGARFMTESGTGTDEDSSADLLNGLLMRRAAGSRSNTGFLLNHS